MNLFGLMGSRVSFLCGHLQGQNGYHHTFPVVAVVGRERVRAEMQKCTNAEMQKCKNAKLIK